MSRAERLDNLRDIIEEETWNVWVYLTLIKEWQPERTDEATENTTVQIARKHLAAYKIQQWWLFITSSPEYAVGRRRIGRGYDKEFGEKR